MPDSAFMISFLERATISPDLYIPFETTALKSTLSRQFDIGKQCKFVFCLFLNWSDLFHHCEQSHRYQQFQWNELSLWNFLVVNADVKGAFPADIWSLCFYICTNLWIVHSQFLFCFCQWGQACESPRFTPRSWGDTFSRGTPRKRKDKCSPLPGLLLDWRAQTCPVSRPRSQHRPTSPVCRLQQSEAWLVSGNKRSTLSHKKDINRGWAEDCVNQIRRGPAAAGRVQRREPTVRWVPKKVYRSKRKMQGSGHQLPGRLPHLQAHSWDRKVAGAQNTNCEILREQKFMIKKDF